MYRGEFFNRLQLYHYSIINQQINPKTFVEGNIIIYKRYRFLPLNPQTALFKCLCKHALIDGLQ